MDINTVKLFSTPDDVLFERMIKGEVMVSRDNYEIFDKYTHERLSETSKRPHYCAGPSKIMRSHMNMRLIDSWVNPVFGSLQGMYTHPVMEHIYTDRITEPTGRHPRVLSNVVYTLDLMLSMSILPKANYWDFYVKFCNSAGCEPKPNKTCNGEPNKYNQGYSNYILLENAPYDALVNSIYMPIVVVYDPTIIEDFRRATREEIFNALMKRYGNGQPMPEPMTEYTLLNGTVKYAHD